MLAGSVSCLGVLVRAFSLALLLAWYCFAQYHFDTPKDEGEKCGFLGSQVWTCQRDCPNLQALINSGRKITCTKKGSVDIVCCPPRPVGLPDRSFQTVSQRKCLEYQSMCIGPFINGGVTRPFAKAREVDAYKDFRPMRGKRDLVVDGDVWKSDNGTVEAVMKQYGNHSDTEDAEQSDRKLKTREEDEDGEDEDIWEPESEGEAPVTSVYGIYNGNRSAPGEFPHAALIGYGKEDSVSWDCGGTLISERYVLSAAHCSIVSKTSGVSMSARWVRLGDLDYSTDRDDARPQQFRIIKRIVHKDYIPSSFYNDIALFKLGRHAVFDQYVAPACLYPHMDDPAEGAIATGWGRLGIHQRRSAYLMKVDLDFISNEECNKIINSEGILGTKALASGIDKQSMICAWKEDKDTCQGDSGGPLVLADKGDNCLAQLVGITSFGTGQCDYTLIPGVYVRVANFIPWIESIVWPEYFSHARHGVRTQHWPPKHFLYNMSN